MPRLISSLSRLYFTWTSPRSRAVLEYTAAVVAIVLLWLTFRLHSQFVTLPAADSPTCLQRLLHNASINIQTAELPFDVLYIEVTGFWTQLQNEKDAFKSGRAPIQRDLVAPLLRLSGFEFDDVHDPEVLQAQQHYEEEDNLDHALSNPFTLPEDYDLTMFPPPEYEYSRERGLLLLSPEARERFGVRVVNLTLASSDSCLGDSLVQSTLENLVGYDTVVLNDCLHTFGGRGYVLNKVTGEMYRLGDAAQPSSSLAGKLEAVVFGAAVFVSVACVVGVALRELQRKLVELILRAQHYRRSGLGRTARGWLVLQHVVYTALFVLCMLGMWVYVSELVEDSLVGLMVMALVWTAELFVVLIATSPAAGAFFPRLALCYFVVYYVYYALYPTGFSYLAFMALFGATQHLMLFILHRTEGAAATGGDPIPLPARPSARPPQPVSPQAAAAAATSAQHPHVATSLQRFY